MTKKHPGVQTEYSEQEVREAVREVVHERLRPHILHVEDDYIKAANLRTCLDDFGVDVTIEHVTNVDDGLASLAAGSYACVVTDWNLGGGTGDTIVRECHRLDLPVCVMSGSFRLMTDVEWFTSDRLSDVVVFVRRHVEAP